jgi:glutathione peroxidase
MKLLSLATLTAAAIMLLGPAENAQATPAFARKENKQCVYCHLQPGKARGFRGLYYAAHNGSFEGFDEIAEAKLAGVKPGSTGPDTEPKSAAYPNVKPAPVLRFTAKDIDGKPVNLARYSGDVILIVNVASKCGNTPQYEGLQKLYSTYKDKGFTILGFPANEFGKQEPGTNAEIKEFCTATYKVAFPMFSKVVVKGEGIDPLYKFLTSKETNPKFGGDIEWNFAKFLVNRKGEIIARIPAGKDASKGEYVKLIEEALAGEK